MQSESSESLGKVGKSRDGRPFADVSPKHRRFWTMRENFLRKRHRRVTREEDALLGSPARKHHITSDLVAQRLSHIRLQSAPPPGFLDPVPAHDPPPSTDPPLSSDLDDMDSSSESEEEEKGTLELTPELKSILEAQRAAFSPWVRVPAASSAVVLWEDPAEARERLLGTKDAPIVTFPAAQRPTAAVSPRFLRKPNSLNITELPPAPAPKDSQDSQAEPMDL